MILTFEDLVESWGSPLQKASDKGYPKLYDDASYWVLYHNDLAVAYTSSYHISDNCVLVGNTYVRKEWRGNGIHSMLLNYRNNAPHMIKATKVTVVNPIESTKIEQLEKTIKRLGYKKVQKSQDVSDVMSESIYTMLVEGEKQIWRL